MNRRNTRRFVNGKRLSAVLGATYVDELSDFSFREQLNLFNNFSVFLMSHGAGESNFMASSSWQAQDTIPASAIIVCPPYLHCGCITTGVAIDGGGTCARHYKPVSRQDMLMNTVVYEYSDKNCSQFCSAVQNSKVSVKKWRARLRDVRTYPPLPLEAISRILWERVYPRVRMHCLGNTSAHGVDYQFKDQSFTVYLDDKSRCSYSMILRGIDAEGMLLDMLMAHAYSQAIGTTFCGAAGYLSEDQNHSLSHLIQVLGLADDLPLIVVDNAVILPDQVRMHQILRDDYYRYDLMDEQWQSDLTSRSTRYTGQKDASHAHLMTILLVPSNVSVIDGTLNISSDRQSIMSQRAYLDIIHEYRQPHSRVVVFGTEAEGQLDGFRGIGCDIKLNSPQLEIWEHIMDSDLVVFPAQHPRLRMNIPILLTTAELVHVPSKRSLDLS